ncbi:hypothetical protein F5Y17DRAFT_458963 [Xylariaceae sp. FL0594]|nr:hypothetical protein F5Y17DRAFT_458963 [Xylariaceae sp. FL0594]
MEFNTPSFIFRSDIAYVQDKPGDADPVTDAEPMVKRKPSLRTNFSYPRASRHEPSESRSSNGSVPGMTDASDSDISLDEYNTSAAEIWDSYWQSSTELPVQHQPQDLGIQQPRHPHENYEIDPTQRYSSEEDGDTIRVSSREQHIKADEAATSPRRIQVPRGRHTHKRNAATYSIYPKAPLQRELLLPRTSSLSIEPASPPRRSSVARGGKSNAALRLSKSTHDINRLFVMPPLMPKVQEPLTSPPPWIAVTGTANSVPVSPAYPPPHTPKTLRPTASTFNLRDINSGAPKTAPLPALSPSALPRPPPSPPRPARPQMERFVSVFELDSDSESEKKVAEERNSHHNSLAKRIARGLHKKSASEKRGGSTGFGGSFSSDSPDKYKGRHPDDRSRDFSGSFSRKRGGSLGRIFGLMGR